MPSKARTLAGILRPRRHAGRAHTRGQHDPATAAVHGSARWQAVRVREEGRDAPIGRDRTGLGLTEPATQVDHVVPLDGATARLQPPGPGGPGPEYAPAQTRQQGGCSAPPEHHGRLRGCAGEWCRVGAYTDVALLDLRGAVEATAAGGRGARRQA